MNPLNQVITKWLDQQPLILGYLRKHLKDEFKAQDLKVYHLSFEPHYQVGAQAVLRML